jgi:hypothetical protein
MKIHIVGAGPTGMSIAWELKKFTDHDVFVYDKKLSAGGSWWEPSTTTRDMHAHRIVFDRAFVNTKSLFKEMGIAWDDLFEKVSTENDSIIREHLSAKDYVTLAALATKVLAMPWKYKTMTLKDAIGELSEKGQQLIEAVTLIMDGVTWDVMTAYEFVKSFDHVGLSSPYTQKGSGKIMCDAMEQALVDVGVHFEFGAELQDVTYLDNGFAAQFKSGLVLKEGMLILAVDNTPAVSLMKDNWGEDAVDKVAPSTYGAINILLEYDQEMDIPSDLRYVIDTELRLQPIVLPDKKTISCVICHLTEEIVQMDQEKLFEKVIEQLGLVQPREIRIGWGATWNGTQWEFDQSSGVLNTNGQLPFFGKSKKVAMCGMMSPRKTPYSSIEAAVEVGRSFCHRQFGTRRPYEPFMITHIILLLIVLLIILVYRRRR